MKIGPHVQHSSDATRRWLQVSPIVKICDQGPELDFAHPNAITIFRYVIPDNQKDTITPQDAFNRTIDALKGRRPTLIESQNEWKDKVSTGLAEHLIWLKEYCRIAHQHGYLVCGPNWSWGTWEQPEAEMMQANDFGGVDVIGLHEYWRNAEPFDGWNALRYRKLHEWWAGVHPLVIVTEAGGENTTDANALQRLQEYNAEISKDSYVLGACAFGAGSYPDWIAAGYDWDARIEEILPLYSGVEEPEMDDPRIQQLLDQNALITQALIDFRHGRFSGAEGMDGKIVALNGGVLPSGWNPSYPPKA